MQSTQTLKGRGAGTGANNRFNKYSYSREHIEMIDDVLIDSNKTQFIKTYPKSILNKVESEDIGLEYSLNPYQGCEHGCIYCYARNSHEYWGFNAGLDFEQKIIVKENVVELLEKQLSKKNWDVKPIMLSGNTDCYQPIEKQLELTRKVLQTCLKYRRPVGIITKNSLVLRDLDILQELAKMNLVHVMVSITGTDETIRMKLEPRTSTYKNRFDTIEKLSSAGIPCGVMIAPIIPGINNHEIPTVMELAAKAGASSAGYTMVRLNGAIGPVFKDWLKNAFPDKSEKVWKQICESHGGNPNDSRFGVRMRGEGKMAESIKLLFTISKKRFLKNENTFRYNMNLFNHKAGEAQLSLF